MAGPTAVMGTVFKITPSGTLTTLYSFCAQSGCTDGEFPLAGLVQDTNGDFYGTTTSWRGQTAYGTVFSLSVGLGPFVETQPTSGKVGAAVKILGTDLTGATSVTFNGTAARSPWSRAPDHDHRTRRRDHRNNPGGDTRRHAFEQRAFPGVALESALHAWGVLEFGW